MSLKPLWAPWRMEYLKNPRKERASECVFCDLVQENEDRKNLILQRGKSAFVVLNKFPYNNGHLMVIPYQHTGDLMEVKEDAHFEIWNLMRQATAILKKAYNPQGFNIGMNVGRVAGAGIPQHIHLHIVPRWEGDSNFMPILAETKALPQHLLTTFDLLEPLYKKEGTP